MEMQIDQSSLFAQSQPSRDFVKIAPAIQLALHVCGLENCEKDFHESLCFPGLHDIYWVNITYVEAGQQLGAPVGTSVAVLLSYESLLIEY
jgi:hypothetical protein